MKKTLSLSSRSLLVIQRRLKKYRDGKHFGAEREVRQPWAVVVKRSFWEEATYRGP